MKKKMILNRFSSGILATVALLFVITSCSEWVEDESVSIQPPTLEIQQPEQYAKYLANLRVYKATDHKYMYAWFDNTKTEVPNTRAYRFDAVPDSVDVICLMKPDQLPQWQQEDMREVRQKKGTRFIYSINFQRIKEEYYAKWEAEKPVLKPGEYYPFDYPKYYAYLEKSVSDQLLFCQQYDYDGICVAYSGKESQHLDTYQMEIYVGEHDAFLKNIKKWRVNNKHKLLIWEGSSFNILDQSILEGVEQVIVPTWTALSLEDVKREVYRYLAKGISIKNLIVATQTLSLLENDTNTGYYGTRIAIEELSYWVGEMNAGSYNRAGIAILNIQNDYFNSYKTYRYTKQAIQNMN